MSQNCRIGRTYRARKVSAGPLRTRKAFELEYNPAHLDVIWSGHQANFDQNRIWYSARVIGFLSHKKEISSLSKHKQNETNK